MPEFDFDRLVKEMTVADHILVTACTTFLTYVFLFLINLYVSKRSIDSARAVSDRALAASESNNQKSIEASQALSERTMEANLKAGRASRIAEQAKFYADKRLDLYNQLLLDLALGGVSIRNFELKLRAKLFAGTNKEMQELYTEMWKSVISAMASSVRIGWVHVPIGDQEFQTKPLDLILDTVLLNTNLEGADGTEALARYNESVNTSIAIVRLYRDFELSILALRHRYADEDIPREEIEPVLNDFRRQAREFDIAGLEDINSS